MVLAARTVQEWLGLIRESLGTERNLQKTSKWSAPLLSTGNKAQQANDASMGILSTFSKVYVGLPQ